MDLHIPVLVDDDPVPVTCDFENTLVRMTDVGGSVAVGEARYAILRMLVDLYDRQDIAIHILTEREMQEDVDNSLDSVENYCARLGLPITEVHYTTSDEERMAVLTKLDPALHLDDSEEIVELAMAEGIKCILVASSDNEETTGEVRDNHKSMVIVDAAKTLGDSEQYELRGVIDVEAPEDEDGIEMVEIGGEQMIPIDAEELLAMLGAVKVDDDTPAPTFEAPAYLPESLVVPNRQTPRSSVVDRLVLRNQILSNEAPIAILPLLDDVTELSVALNNVLIQLAANSEGLCPLCGVRIDGKHKDSEVPCWIGELNTLLRCYTA
jgi:hypothetical protein